MHIACILLPVYSRTSRRNFRYIASTVNDSVNYMVVAVYNNTSSNNHVCIAPYTRSFRALFCSVRGRHVCLLVGPCTQQASYFSQYSDIWAICCKVISSSVIFAVLILRVCWRS